MLEARIIDTHKIYTILKHGGADEPLAEALVEAMKEATDSSVAHLTTKEDLAVTKFELKEDIAAAKSELKNDIAAVRSELKEDIAAVKSELKEDIAAVENKLSKEIFEIKGKLNVLTNMFFGFFALFIIDIIINLLHLHV